MKKIVRSSLLLVLLSVFLLVGCTGGPESEVEVDAGIEVAQEEEAAPDAAEPEVAPAVAAEPEPEEDAEERAEERGPVSILFVGNSFTFYGDVPGQLQTLAGAQGVEIIYRDISRGGATLNDSKESAIQEMEAGNFDYIVLQDQSMRPAIDLNGFLDDVRALSGAARENGVTLVLFNPAAFDEDMLQVMANAAYSHAAEVVDAILIDAGGAWLYADLVIPGLAPAKGGNQAFLAACVFAATLFDLHITEIPDGNRYNSGDALALAQIAWDFVRSS